MNQQLVYLDAGTGSLLISAIVAGAAGLGVILRLGWRRMVGFFSPKQRAEQRVGNQHPAERRPVEDPPSRSATGGSAERRG